MKRLKDLALFARLLRDGISANHIFDKAASLSYFTLIAFVPLAAAFVSVYIIFFPDYHEQLALMFKEFLPYENTEWLTYLEQFLAQARNLGGIALIIFFLIALRVLMIIESNINQVWGVDRQRTLGSRVSSFTLLLFWGPVLMGLMGSLFFLLQKQPAFPQLLLLLGPKLITLLTFTMLFWTVPYTRVRLDSAFLGGATTTLLLMVGKWGFLAYLRGMKVFAGILGSLGLVLLFFITINLLWFFASVEPNDVREGLYLLLGELSVCSVDLVKYMAGIDEEDFVFALCALLSFVEEPQRAGQGNGVEEVRADRHHDNDTVLNDLLPDLKLGATCI